MASRVRCTHAMPALIVFALAAPALAQAPATAPQRPVASVNQQPRVDAVGMARPIDMHDTIWIEAMPAVVDGGAGGTSPASCTSAPSSRHPTPAQAGRMERR